MFYQRIPNKVWRDDGANQHARIRWIGLPAWLILSAVFVCCGCKSGNPGVRTPISFAATKAAQNRPDSRYLAAKTALPRDSNRPAQSGPKPADGLDATAGESGKPFATIRVAMDQPSTDVALADGLEAADDDDYRLVAFQQSDAAAPSELATEVLSLDQVLASVGQSYPEIDIAFGELESAEGKILASWGEFDSILAGHSISQPLSFYQNYRNGIGLARPLYGGGEVYGTYRIGDGDFEPWYGERDTNEGGEFKSGFSLPILKDRNIDARRANLLAAQADRDQVEANVESRLLFFQRFATQAYWDWVASGQAVKIQERLLALADKRVAQINQRVEKGDLAKLAQIDNQRFIAKRKNSLIKTRRAQEKSAIKLSLFYRDANGSPIIPEQSVLPASVPESSSIETPKIESDIANAFQVRPELVELGAARNEACIDLRYARNLTLPKLDMKGFASQDVGGETSSKGDKTPFELNLGLYAEVPLQRREGLGKIQAAEGKLSQIDAKIRFVSDKIRAEIQDAASAVNAAHDQIRQSTENVRLAAQSLELGRLSFEAGDIDLIELNIYETSVADAEFELLDAQFKYFFYRSIYETAIKGNSSFF